MKIALVQFNATGNKEKNIQRSMEFVREAIAQKASWVLLPEIFTFRGNLRDAQALALAAESIPGATTKVFFELARQYKIDILLGSILERSSSKKVYNTSVFLGGRSGQLKKYRKIHLFDANVSGKIIREADVFAAGRSGATVSVGEFKAGLSVCYDLRFADLYKSYSQKGVTVLTSPSCFTKETGQAHWESLLRARAIENLSYVLAPNQVGEDSRGIRSFGHSMVVGPWGEIVACASANKEEIVYADISMDQIKQARRKLPGIVKG